MTQMSFLQWKCFIFLDLWGDVLKGTLSIPGPLTCQFINSTPPTGSEHQCLRRWWWKVLCELGELERLRGSLSAVEHNKKNSSKTPKAERLKNKKLLCGNKKGQKWWKRDVKMCFPASGEVVRTPGSTSPMRKEREHDQDDLLRRTEQDGRFRKSQLMRTIQRGQEREGAEDKRREKKKTGRCKRGMRESESNSHFTLGWKIKED